MITYSTISEAIADNAVEDPQYAIAWAILVVGEKIAKAIGGLAEPMRSDHPLQGETFGGMEYALSQIAEALQAIADTK